jgi:alpha-galactosidase
MKYSKLFTIGLIGLCLQSFAHAADAGWVHFSQDTATVVADSAGITEFSAVSSAVYQVDGKNLRVGTRGFQLIGAVRSSEAATPFGTAQVSQATYGREGSPYQYTLTIKQLNDLQAFTVQGVFHNYSDADVNLQAFDLLDTRKGSGGSLQVENPAEWLVTPLMQDKPALTLDVAKDTLNEAAMLYRPNGDGFLVGPLGPPVAYCNVQFVDQSLVASFNMDGVLVRAGESRRSE